jgi:hypothetical protein
MKDEVASICAAFCCKIEDGGKKQEGDAYFVSSNMTVTSN